MNTAESYGTPTARAVANALQWGRRVNTAESLTNSSGGTINYAASMGPPREHGGKVKVRDLVNPFADGFNGAAA